MKKSQSLTISPEWDEIETVRNKCSEFFLENGISESIIHAGAMVVSELLENSIKYGLELQLDGGTITIAVSETCCPHASKIWQGILFRFPPNGVY